MKVQKINQSLINNKSVEKARNCKSERLNIKHAGRKGGY